MKMTPAFARTIRRFFTQTSAIPEPPADAAGLEFFRLGLQYYVAGRQAAFAELNPVAANLLHHAAEMFLKGALARRTRDLRSLRELGHRLDRLWQAFKRESAGAALDAFDGTIAQLDKFGWIRFSNSVVELSLRSMIDLTSTADPPETTALDARSQLLRYGLVLRDIDELLRAIVATTDLDSHVLTRSLNAQAREILRRPPHTSIDAQPSPASHAVLAQGNDSSAVSERQWMARPGDPPQPPSSLEGAQAST